MLRLLWAACESRHSPGQLQGKQTWAVIMIAIDFFLESIFIDQATLNGTRPNSPSLAGVKPARPLVGYYFMVQFRE
jgi:hypothetical protein